MGLFGKKDNGINWQKEVFETSKKLPAILKELESMGRGFHDHVDAGRKQRDEDKIQRKEDKVWQALLLDNSLKCSEEKRIGELEIGMKELKIDKTLKKGKILGMKSIYVIVVAVLMLVGSILGILWKLRLL